MLRSATSAKLPAATNPALRVQSQPSLVVPHEQSCYHFRVLDPRLPLCRPLADLHWLRNRRDYVGPPVLTRLQSVHSVGAGGDGVEDPREHTLALVGG
jgi:hypothetical protein